MASADVGTDADFFKLATSVFSELVSKLGHVPYKPLACYALPACLREEQSELSCLAPSVIYYKPPPMWTVATSATEQSKQHRPIASAVPAYRDRPV